MKIPMRLCVVLFLSTIFIACKATPENTIIDGILEVPENRNNPNSRKLQLVYKVLKSKNTTSKKAPILYLQGGPGAATLIMEAFWDNHPLRDERDIVLMDQRGTGASGANCTAVGEAMFAILRKDYDDKAEFLALGEILSECKASMAVQGVDLSGYTSAENAADYEALRRALGYDKWNLFGGSYGSRLGLTIMRDFPNSVRSAVLFSVFSPEAELIGSGVKNFENSLFKVLALCENDASCKGRYPNLKKRLLNTLEQLKSAPLHFEYDNQQFVFNSQDALVTLHQALYSRATISSIPSYIEAIENENYEVISAALQRVEFIYDFINWPMHFSIMAYEEIPFIDEEEAAKVLKESELALGSNSYITGIELFSEWHSFRAAAIENQAVSSNIPTLMASGELDPVTPSSNASEALKHLKNSYEVLFANEGHEYFNSCFFQISTDFLDNPNRQPDLDCLSAANPIDWNLSGPIN